MYHNNAIHGMGNLVAHAVRINNEGELEFYFRIVGKTDGENWVSGFFEAEEINAITEEVKNVVGRTTSNINAYAKIIYLGSVFPGLEFSRSYRTMLHNDDRDLLREDIIETISSDETDPEDRRKLSELLVALIIDLSGLVPLHERRAEFNKKREELLDHLKQRDGAICKNCNTTENLSVDHIIPISLGGSDDMENLQILCCSCNSSKGNRIQ